MQKELIHKYISPLSPIPTGISPCGKITSAIKCVLFDIYGTLFISSSGDISIAQKINCELDKLYELFNRYGIKASPEVIKEKLLNEITNTHELLKKKGVDYPEVEIDRIWQAVLNISDNDRIRQFGIEYEMIVNPVYPMPNLLEILSYCVTKNILLGIISNAQFFTPMLFKWFLEKDLSDLSFNKDLSVFSYQYHYAKPSMALFDIAVRRLDHYNINPHEVLYIGNDMLNDIYPARKTGFRTALFAGDKRSLRLRKDDNRCRKIAPDLVLTDLIQLKKHLAQ